MQVEVEPSVLGGNGEHAQGTADAESSARCDAPADALVNQEPVGLAVKGEPDRGGLAVIEAFQAGNGEHRGGFDLEPAGRAIDEGPQCAR